MLHKALEHSARVRSVVQGFQQVVKDGERYKWQGQSTRGCVVLTVSYLILSTWPDQRSKWSYQSQSLSSWLDAEAELRARISQPMAMHDLEDLHASFLMQSCFFYLSQCPVQRVEWVNETLSKLEQLASVPREIEWWRVLNKCPRKVSKCSCGLDKSLSIEAETCMTCYLGARPVLWTKFHLWRDRTWTDDQYSIAAVWTWFHKIVISTIFMDHGLGPSTTLEGCLYRVSLRCIREIPQL